MTNKELQALRKVLMMDVAEAAELVGGVSPRSWQYWEAGRSPVPDDVAVHMETLIHQRADLIDSIEESVKGVPPDQWADRITLPFYQHLEGFLAVSPSASALDWRVNQSVAAAYYADGLARLA